MEKCCPMRERKRSFSIACGSVLRASKKKLSHLPLQKVEYRDEATDRGVRSRIRLIF